MVGILFYAHILRRLRPFPFVLFLVYFDLNLTNLVIIGLIILIFTKILMFYKWVFSSIKCGFPINFVLLRS